VNFFKKIYFNEIYVYLIMALIIHLLVMDFFILLIISILYCETNVYIYFYFLIFNDIICKILKHFSTINSYLFNLFI
jgi:hypothetical protein